jgi:squalene-associated FAD-dependent desaturase
MAEQGKRVAIVGGGLAGLAAACALADAGFPVTVFERRPYVGGRASSYQHPGTNEVVDNCQHVLLGCCTNLLDFYARLGVAEKIRWFDRLSFVEPGGRTSEVGSSWLPPPFHTAPSFLRNHALGLRDKLAISRALLSLIGGLPEDTEENFLSWLRRHGQTERAIERFWKVVLVSALNEDLDRSSVYYAAQVFRESFLKSRQAGRMGVPTVPLTELYGAAADYLRARGGEVALRASVESFAADADTVELKVSADGDSAFAADYLVLAAPFQAVLKLLADHPEAEELRSQLERFESSPITGIHLWFDRRISDLPHAVLLDRTIQWMFHKSELLGRDGGSYVELVVSSSKSFVDKPRGEIMELALRELADFFPAVRDAKLLKWTVIKEVNATYSALPRSDRYRPETQTQWPRVFLAGDWTRSGWPATMESAVRSGYKAAEALTAAAGSPRRFLLPDLPPRGLMRLFAP